MCVNTYTSLLSGIATFDSEQDEMFLLHAYLIAVFGDIPAISMIMRMKGHNAIFPCRMCMIKGVRLPETRNTTHYVPLYCANHPVVLENNLEIPIYDPANLPLRTHEQFLEQARHVQLAPTTAEEERRAKACGIKGIPVLSHLPSLFFPSSFPFDFMHLVWENLIPNLVLLWTGKFKGLDEGRESYHLGPGVWEAIGEATKASGATVPAAYASARPHNIAEDMSACTADSWSFWALYLGPVLLRGRFSKDAYYKHFVLLIKLLRTCLQFEISRDELSEIREGFQDWVKTYERYAFFKLGLQLLTLTFAMTYIVFITRSPVTVFQHALLPSMRYSTLLMGLKPWDLSGLTGHSQWSASVGNFYVASKAAVTHSPTLTPILPQSPNWTKSRTVIMPTRISHFSHQKKIVLGSLDLKNVIFFKHARTGCLGLIILKDPTSVLCFPRQINPTILEGLLTKIIATLVTRYNTTHTIIKRHLSVNDIEIWEIFVDLKAVIR